MAMRDVILVMVVLFLLGAGFFVLNFVGNTVSDELTNVAAINESETVTDVFDSIGTNVDKLDYFILVVFIGLVLALMITAWFVGGYPIFMFIYFIVILLGVVMSAVFANVWTEVVGVSAFGSTIANFPVTNNLLSNLPIYIGVVGTIAIIVMFAKPREE